MAENITLASFEFDSSRLEKSIADLQQRLVQLKKEQKGYAEQSKELQKQSESLSGAMAVVAQQGGQNSAEYKKLTMEFLGVKEAQLQVTTSQQNLNIQAGKTRSEYDQTVKTFQSLLGVEGNILSMKAAVQQALDRELTSVNAARASNEELLNLRNLLNPAIQSEAALIDKLNGAYNENAEYLSQNAQAVENQKTSLIGYKDSIMEALNAINPFNGGLAGFIDRANQAGGVGPLLTTSFNAITTGMMGATKAGLAFLATPIGAAIGALAATIGIVVGAFKFMSASMNSTEEGSQKLAQVTAAITGVFDGLWNLVKPLGEFIGTVFIKSFELASAAVDAAVGLISDGLRFLGFDDAADGVDKFSEEVKASSQAAADLARAEGELAKMQRDNKTAQQESQRQAEKLKELRDDESKSTSERIALNNQLGEVQKKQLNNELALAQKALEIANERVKKEGETAEALNARAEATAKVYEAEDRMAKQASQQLADENAIRKQAADAENQRREEARAKRQKALDDYAEKLDKELQLYIQAQGNKARTLEEEVAMAEEVHKRKLAIAQAEFNASEKTENDKLQHQIAVNAATMELNTAKAQAVVKNAEEEAAAFIRNNESQLEEKKRLDDALVNGEIARLNKIDELEKAALKARLDNHLITQQEHDQLLLEQTEATVAKKKEITDQYDAQKAEDEVLKGKLEHAQKLLTLDTEGWEKFEREQLIVDEQYKVDKAKLDAQLKNDEISAENHKLALDNLDKERKQTSDKIEEEKQNFKIDIAKSTLGNLATIAGKETAAGKAFAIAQTLMDTYQSATSAFKSMSGIPIVGPALGGAAAAAAVVSGLANVKKITATKEPKVKGYATGGIITGGAPVRRANGDNVLITAKTGEAILNKDQQSFIGSQLLSAAGVPGFATGGIVGASSRRIVQNSVINNFNTAELSQQIASAVQEGAAIGTRQGASEGSQMGIIGLSENRQIQNNASY